MLLVLATMTTHLLKNLFHHQNHDQHHVIIIHDYDHVIMVIFPVQTTSPTMPRCHSPSTTLSPLGGAIIKIVNFKESL